jgi:hypothetical protein
MSIDIMVLWLQGVVLFGRMSIKGLRAASAIAHNLPSAPPGWERSGHGRPRPTWLLAPAFEAVSPTAFAPPLGVDPLPMPDDPLSVPDDAPLPGFDVLAEPRFGVVTGAVLDAGVEAGGPAGTEVGGPVR